MRTTTLIAIVGGVGLCAATALATTVFVYREPLAASLTPVSAHVAQAAAQHAGPASREGARAEPIWRGRTLGHLRALGARLQESTLQRTDGPRPDASK